MVVAGRHLPRVIAAAAIAILLAPASLAAQSVHQHPATHIANFDVVAPNIYRGGVPTTEGFQDLENLGVKTIIDLQTHASRKEQQQAQAHGIQLIHIPMGYLAPSDKLVRQVLKILVDAGHGAVFIHCRQGADRTGTIVALYRVLVQNWTFNKAYQEMRAHHFKPWLFPLREKVEDTCANGGAECKTAIHSQIVSLPSGSSSGEAAR